MERKLRDYFAAGVRLVWFIDPPTESAEAFAATDQRQSIPRGGILSGGEVLPGFELSLTDLFDRAGRRKKA
jgi:Uma2 family endonuclease